MCAKRFAAVSGSPVGREVGPPNNLPAHLTHLIGREVEVAQARQHLQRAEVRLLTLMGTGGVGKTRLALHVAEDLLWDFEGGVYVINLASTNQPDLVLPAIAQTLGVKESADGTLPCGLERVLRAQAYAPAARQLRAGSRSRAPCR